MPDDANAVALLVRLGSAEKEKREALVLWAAHATYVLSELVAKAEEEQEKIMALGCDLIAPNNVLRGATYWFVCDGCKTRFPEENSKLVFLDCDELTRQAEEKGWVLVGRKQYCPACYEQWFEEACVHEAEARAEGDLNDDVGGMMP